MRPRALTPAFVRLAAGVLFLLAGLPARAQTTPVVNTDPPTSPVEPPADTDVGQKPGLAITPVVYSPIFYSPSAGFGLGLGANIQNVGRPGSSLLVQVVTAQKRGQYGAWYQTAPPYGPGFSVLGGGFYEADGNYTYYGIGPASREANEIALDRRLLEAELRPSFGFGTRGRLRAQAFTRLQRHRIERLDEIGPNAVANLDAASGTALDATVDADPTVLNVGGDLIYDVRSNLYNPERALLVQVGAFRTTHVGGRDFRNFWQRQYAGLVTIPVGTSARVTGRLTVVDSDARAGTPVVLLPMLDTDIGVGLQRHRYVGADFVYASLEYAKPVFDLFGFVAADGVLTAAAFQSYDDLRDQFKPSITFDKTVDASRKRVPLRPAAGAGLRFYSDFLEATVLNLTFGYSREGFALGTFSVVTDFRAPRPLLRSR